ncbi:MAG: acyl-CoA dehydrogenase N-terminal domain-containing protein, partial [Marinobacter sp.]|nr:acyl-CoA dehydrogenase N-terminal domain-containing protein [Marinobacter sp.]
MRQKIINTQDLAFQLFELHEVEQSLGYERYAEHNRETLQAAL